MIATSRSLSTTSQPLYYCSERPEYHIDNHTIYRLMATIPKLVPALGVETPVPGLLAAMCPHLAALTFVSDPKRPLCPALSAARLAHVFSGSPKPDSGKAPFPDQRRARPGSPAGRCFKGSLDFQY
ncbi:hypothetical protein HOY82DRAFT_604917 [Tuber indicum]|nr:hypothetical protein HOY82DRAFT_604917 [Tuber indicum]